MKSIPSSVRQPGSSISFPSAFTQVGAPCIDDGRELPLHGCASTLWASNISCGTEWESDDRCRICVTGTMQEYSLFGANLQWRRTITSYLGEGSFTKADTIENQGIAESPLMFLQHFNLEWPLIGPSSELILPTCTTRPRDNNAKNGIDNCNHFDLAHDLYPEQVFYHDCSADADGIVEVSLVNKELDEGRGIRVTWQWRKEQYPYLIQWKLMQAESYVCGIEPANCHVGGRVEERNAGRLQTIKPGEKRRFSIEVRFS